MKRFGGAVMLVALLGAAGCSDGGGVSAGQFAGQIDDVCRALDRDLAKLEQPATVADLAGYAGDASTAYEDALAALKKLAREKLMLTSVLLDIVTRTGLKGLVEFVRGTDAASVLSLEGEKT